MAAIGSVRPNEVPRNLVATADFMEKAGEGEVLCAANMEGEAEEHSTAIAALSVSSHS